MYFRSNRIVADQSLSMTFGPRTQYIACVSWALISSHDEEKN